MTRKELEKSLKRATAQEMSKIVEDSEPQDLLRSLIAILHMRRIALRWKIVGYFYWGWFSASGLKHVIYDNHVPIHGGFLLAFQLFVWAVLFSLGCKKLSPQGWQNGGVASKALNVLLARIDLAGAREVGAICSALWWARGGLYVTQESPLNRKVADLLLHLDDDEARKLPDYARRWIRWRLKRGASPEFRIAGLLTLSSGGDKKIASVARGLQGDADERVRAAAGECLRLLRVAEKEF